LIESFFDPMAWWALFQISIINILLSGDNAVVIALACRNLPAKQAKTAFMIGAVGAIVIRTGLTTFAAFLLTIPYIELIGSVLLLWIGVKLFVADDEEGDVKSSENFWDAVKIIVIADIVMSLDNVLGMAAAAKGHVGLLILGLVLTVPLILFSSALVMKLMDRFPIFITLGATLLGYVAGEMAIEDPAVKTYIDTHAAYLHYVSPIAGALFVLGIGKMMKAKSAKHAEEAPPGS
jgi:hypothetical protein